MTFATQVHGSGPGLLPSGLNAIELMTVPAITILDSASVVAAARMLAEKKVNVGL